MSFTRWASVLVAAVVAFASPVFAAPSATAGAPGFASWSDATAPTFTSPNTAPETKSDQAAPDYQLCEPTPGKVGVSAAKYAPRYEVHTYFVAAREGAHAAWVHNTSIPDASVPNAQYETSVQEFNRHTYTPGTLPAGQGVVYVRTTPTGEEYVGQSKSEKTFRVRMRAHDRGLPKGQQHTFRILGTAKPGADLDALEEAWIRAGGGPGGNVNGKPHSYGGKLMNKRFQMNDPQFRAGGGTVGC